MSDPQLEIVPGLEAPHSIAAEQALLGALLYNNDLWDEIEGGLTAEHFYDKRHRIIYAELAKLISESRADPVLLAQALKDSGKLKEAGGEEYLYDIQNISESVVNVGHYAGEIRRTAILRRMHAVFQAANARVLHPDGSSPEKILDETEAMLADIGKEAEEGGRGFSSASIKAQEFFDHLTKIVNEGKFDELLGISTGIPDLNKMTTGLHGGDFIVVAARPGGGKTAFALDIVRYVSATPGSSVAVFSLEMSDKSLVMRLISQDRVDMQKLRTGRDWRGRPMNSKDLMDLTTAVNNLHNREIYIDDSGSINILELKSRARRLAGQVARRGGRLSLVVVDYLQLLTAPPSRDGETRAQEVAAISRGLKALAKELNVPVLALSQLNRDFANKDRKNSEPKLSDLRDSGAIEQDADIVLFLHEEPGEGADYNKPPEEGTPMKLIIGKHRNGPVGRIRLNFHKQYSRFYQEATHEEADDSGGGF